MGYQVGATYAVNKMISFAVGARMVMATNTYEGSLSGITIDAPAAYGGTQTPGNYLRTVAGALTGVPGQDGNYSSSEWYSNRPGRSHR